MKNDPHPFTSKESRFLRMEAFPFFLLKDCISCAYQGNSALLVRKESIYAALRRQVVLKFKDITPAAILYRPWGFQMGDFYSI